MVLRIGERPQAIKKHTVYFPSITKNQPITLYVQAPQQPRFNRRTAQAQHQENRPQYQQVFRYSPIHYFSPE
jgi:hypothetical protein